MDTLGKADHVHRVVAALVAALCANDVAAIEKAAREAEKVLETPALRQVDVDPDKAQQLRSLVESAQSLIWTRLLSLWAQGNQSNNALLLKAA